MKFADAMGDTGKFCQCAQRKRGAVEIIQADGGIPVDGVVGPATKIVIYNNLKEYRTPHIGADPKGLG